MTPKHPAAHDAQVRHARTLYAAADAMHRRALAQTQDAIRHASAREWDAAEAATAAARTTQAAADALEAEADAA